MRLLLLLSLLPALVAGISLGKPYRCTISDDSFWGCQTFGLNADGTENRLNCTDTRPGLMPWTARTVPEAGYTLRTGDGPANQDPTSYTPGRLMPIHLRVLESRLKFVGLLLYAVDTFTGSTKVGSFEFADGEGLYWSPWADEPENDCYPAAFHINAATKPLHSVLNFRGPPAGTGEIKFEVLIKVGEPNDGYFYRPATALFLNEGPSPTDEQEWFLGEQDQTCSEYCASQGLGCRETVQNQIPGDFDSVVGDHYACRPPTLAGCRDYDASRGWDGYCYMRDEGACDILTFGTSSCDAVPPAHYPAERFCKCLPDPCQDNPCPNPRYSTCVRDWDAGTRECDCIGDGQDEPDCFNGLVDICQLLPDICDYSGAACTSPSPVEGEDYYCDVCAEDISPCTGSCVTDEAVNQGALPCCAKDSSDMTVPPTCVRDRDAAMTDTASCTCPAGSTYVEGDCQECLPPPRCELNNICSGTRVYKDEDTCDSDNALNTSCCCKTFCDAHACPDDKCDLPRPLKALTECAGSECTDDECCQPTSCDDLNLCGEFFTSRDDTCPFPSERETQDTACLGECDNIQCCSTTCESFTASCPSGSYRREAGRCYGASGCSEQECCFECLQDDHCGAGSVCREFACVASCDGFDCSASNSTIVYEEGLCESTTCSETDCCVECLRDSDCDDNSYCDAETLMCLTVDVAPPAAVGGSSQPAQSESGTHLVVSWVLLAIAALA